jgi:hypothetical protein
MSLTAPADRIIHLVAEARADGRYEDDPSWDEIDDLIEQYLTDRGLAHRKAFGRV